MLAAVLVAGCGSDQPVKVAEPAHATPPNEGIVTNTVPAGPRDPAENLERLLPQSASPLDDVQVTCPELAATPSYPFECKFTGDTHKRQAGVTGTIVVYGVYAPTKTYVYGTRYRPSDVR